MLQLPYINTRAHLAKMMDNYDLFAQGYNHTIEEQRAANPKTKEAYQTLKPTHRALYKDLILEMGKKMLQHIKNYNRINAEQGNAGTFALLSSGICGDGVFICSTNRYQLSKHNAKELSTIYRNIKRLMEAGLISRKVGHGTKKNFELHINADFLIVSDYANNAYNPLESAPTKDFSLLGKIAKCKEKKNVQEHLINKIYSAPLDKDNFSDETQSKNPPVAHGKIGEVAPAAINSIGSVLAPTSGTVTGTRELQTAGPQSKTRQEPGGRAGVQRMIQAKGIDFVQAFVKKDPAQWHGFHRLSHAAYFVDYLIQAIYAKRGVEIFPATRIVAIEYVEKFYFPNPLEKDVKTIFQPCQTIDQYAFRLEQLKWCVDAANRYAAKNGAYFVLISKYLDITNENGLKRTFGWWKNKTQNEADKALHLKNIKEMKQLHQITREVAEGKTTLMEAENYVENVIPKYKYVFRHSLVTIINELEKGKPKEN